ncbi:disulfide oxidoreductase YuzD [Halalkalibacter nanhaiisediminis]|uniref:Disulfide oxidoreductase YuzD n=2 Tax=Halalkalibacter nanhaiisediminis TaxID=688079 RepID=A0A562QTN1_9BACI|nr:disulfide oxidoreductase YuzD [Halalkalibacter nanhaiisediminis]
MEKMKVLSMTVFGAEEKCASCIHLPSARETMEWLDAAISRKFPEVSLKIEYVDIDMPGEDELHVRLAESIRDDEYFYPLVLLNDEIVAEGNPNLKDIFAKIEKWNENNPVSE